MGSALAVAGLFAGIGGLEQGLASSGGHTEMLCEWWPPARDVLARRFPDVPIAGDIRDLRSLPPVDVVTAGFPCTDLSQAGRTRGIGGAQSSLVGEVFRLLHARRVPVLVLENVRNMLVLDGGEAMRYLTGELASLGYRWAYRLVDSRFAGVPQRRQRVLFVAALEIDPRDVLFADDAGEPAPGCYDDEVHGFYWTEGLRGLGWARDAVPTLKGGSNLGIPSPPAVWWPAGPRGGRIVVPDVTEAELLQGFEPGWTESAAPARMRNGPRWKLLGNAVTVGVSAWLGRRLADPGQHRLEEIAVRDGGRWPPAACGEAGKVRAVNASMWPVHEPYRHLREVVDLPAARPLSARATAGFLSRARRGGLQFAPGFLTDVEEHLGASSGRTLVVA